MTAPSPTKGVKGEGSRPGPGKEAVGRCAGQEGFEGRSPGETEGPGQRGAGPGRGERPPRPRSCSRADGRGADGRWPVPPEASGAGSEGRPRRRAGCSVRLGGLFDRVRLRKAPAPSLSKLQLMRRVGGPGPAGSRSVQPPSRGQAHPLQPLEGLAGPELGLHSPPTHPCPKAAVPRSPSSPALLDAPSSYGEPDLGASAVDAAK